MSERYSRLFTLPENLYAIGSPVIISAGTLLKDTQTGKIVVQLKMRSISENVIKAVKISLSLFDIAGNLIEENFEFDYLDLVVLRDGVFGSKTPVYVDAKSRSYSVIVKEVIFADKSIWKSELVDWSPLDNPQKLLAYFNDNELVKQYQIKYGQDCSYWPAKLFDLWFCTCGSINRENEKCYHCNKVCSDLLSMDYDVLLEEKNARVIQETERFNAQKALKDAHDQKILKTLKISVPTVSAITLFWIAMVTIIIPSMEYSKAISLMEAKQFDNAIVAFREMDGYKDSEAKIDECMYRAAENLIEEGNLADAAIAFYELRDYRDSKERSFDLWHSVVKQENISAGTFHTIAIKNDGTTVVAGDRFLGGWNNPKIHSVSAGCDFTVILFDDGNVNNAATYFAGKFLLEKGTLDIFEWKDMVDISAGFYHTVGLKADGTVVATGENSNGCCNTESWNNIMSISAGCEHTVGLKTDGTVIATGNNQKGECNVNEWTNIIEISAGGAHTVGLKADGTVVAVGSNRIGQCDVANWKNIKTIDAGFSHTVAVKSDGTVVATGSNENGQCNVSGWTNIVAISASEFHTVGLKADGTVVVAGEKSKDWCQVDGWKDIRTP